MVSNEKLDLKYKELILLTLNNYINIFPLILREEKYHYFYPSRDYKFLCSYFGFLNGNNAYDLFTSLPRRLLNKDFGKLSDLTIDLFAPIKENIIYLVK